MKYNCRFSPTVNGYLHLGHLVNCLVNEAEARASGGKFGIRFDDDQRFWRWKCGDQMEHYKSQMLADLAHFGIEWDYVHSQTAMSLAAITLIEQEFGSAIPDQSFDPNYGGAEVVGIPYAFYPLVPSITMEKVAFDFIDGINLLIRGFDLLTEDCYYRDYCVNFQIRIPRMVYIPRLDFEGEMPISKTEGNFKLKDFRHIEPGEVIQSLAVDCLKRPSDGWRVDNLKHQLVLGRWAYGTR